MLLSRFQFEGSFADVLLAGSLDYEADYWNYHNFAASGSSPWSYIYSFYHHGTFCALHDLGECQFS